MIVSFKLYTYTNMFSDRRGKDRMNVFLTFSIFRSKMMREIFNVNHEKKKLLGFVQNILMNFVNCD